MKTTRRLTIDEHWTPQQRKHHAPKARIRLQGHWLIEAGFQPTTRATVTVRPYCLTITPAGGTTMHPGHTPTLADLCTQVRAAIAQELQDHPHSIDCDRVAIKTAQDIAPTDPATLLMLAALDDTTLAENRPSHYYTEEPIDHIRANVVDRLWEEATAALFD